MALLGLCFGCLSYPQAHKALKLHLAAASWARKQQAAVVAMRAPGRSFTPCDGPAASSSSSAEDASQHFVAAIYQGTVEPPAYQRLPPSGLGEQHGADAAAAAASPGGDSVRSFGGGGGASGSAGPGAGGANGKKEGGTGIFKSFTRGVSTMSAPSSASSNSTTSSSRGSVMGGRMLSRGSTMIGNRRGSSTGVGMGSVAGGAVVQGVALVAKAHPLAPALRMIRPHLPIKSVNHTIRG